MSEILVTGASGFFGRHIVLELQKNYSQIVEHKGKQDCDFTDQHATREYFKRHKPRFVIHAAAKVGGILANQLYPYQFAYDNLAMGLNIIEECKRHEVERLVMIGTCCSYPCIPKTIPFVEDELFDGQPEPTNAPYGEAKRVLIKVLDSAHKQYGLQSKTLILANLCGPADNFSTRNGHVIPALIEKFHFAKVNNSPFVNVWGDGTATRDFLYVGDAARVVRTALESHRPELVFNIGTGIETSIAELTQKIKDMVGYTGEIKWDGRKPGGQPRRVLNCRRAFFGMGWRVKVHLDDALKLTYKWFKDVELPKILKTQTGTLL